MTRLEILLDQYTRGAFGAALVVAAALLCLAVTVIINEGMR